MATFLFPSYVSPSLILVVVLPQDRLKLRCANRYHKKYGLKQFSNKVKSTRHPFSKPIGTNYLKIHQKIAVKLFRLFA